MHTLKPAIMHMQAATFLRARWQEAGAAAQRAAAAAAEAAASQDSGSTSSSTRSTNNNDKSNHMQDGAVNGAALTADEALAAAQLGSAGLEALVGPLDTLQQRLQGTGLCVLLS